MKTKSNVSDWTTTTLVKALHKLDVPNGAGIIAEVVKDESPTQLENLFRQLGFFVLAGEMFLEDLDCFFGSTIVTSLDDRLVLIDNMKGDQIGFYDPEQGHVEVSVSEFLSRWTGSGRTQYGIIVRMG